MCAVARMLLLFSGLPLSEILELCFWRRGPTLTPLATVATGTSSMTFRKMWHTGKTKSPHYSSLLKTLGKLESSSLLFLASRNQTPIVIIQNLPRIFILGSLLQLSTTVLRGRRSHLGVTEEAQ